VDGHPLQLDTCFIASAEEEGTTCAQSFFGTLGGAKPVIDGVAERAACQDRPGHLAATSAMVPRSRPG
jgi:hypothetical protein